MHNPLNIVVIATTLMTGLAQAAPNQIQRLQPEAVADASGWGFSQAVVAPANGHYIFVSGQFSSNVKGEVIGKTKAEQIKITYQNLKSVIEAAGGSTDNVVQIRHLVVDYKPADLDTIVPESHKLFGKHLPASTLIPVPALAIPEMLYELEATVFVPAN